MINDNNHFLVKNVWKPGPPAGAGCSHFYLSNLWKHIIQQCAYMSWISVLCPRARDFRSASHSKVLHSFASAGAGKHYCFSRREFSGKASCSRTRSSGTLHPEGRAHIWILYVENITSLHCLFHLFSLLKPMKSFRSNLDQKLCFCLLLSASMTQFIQRETEHEHKPLR